jgi:hypothetical protein
LLGLFKNVIEKLNANRINELAAVDFSFSMDDESVSELALA